MGNGSCRETVGGLDFDGEKKRRTGIPGPAFLPG
jgi:hypothetical protein